MRLLEDLTVSSTRPSLYPRNFGMPGNLREHFCAVIPCAQTRDVERTWPWHDGTYERVQIFSPYRKGRVSSTEPAIVTSCTPETRGGSPWFVGRQSIRMCFCCGTASRDAVPHGVWHRRPARRGPTVRGEHPSPIKACATPEQSHHRGRCHACSRT